MVKEQTTKCYITRDEGEDFIWVWLKPTKGNFSPVKLPDSDVICWHREDMENANYYCVKEFKKKFGFIISKKTKKCMRLPSNLVFNEDYKLISNDPDRKK